MAAPLPFYTKAVCLRGFEVDDKAQTLSAAPLVRGLRALEARHVSLIVQRVGQMPEGARLADGTRASERSRRRAGSSGSKRPGANGARSTCRAAPSRISSLIASPVAGALSMPQTLWPVATKAPSTPGTAPMKGRPSSVTGRKHACHALIGAAASAGEIFRHSASSRACAPASAATSAGSTGIGPTVEIAHTHVVPSAPEITRGSGFRRSPRGTRGTVPRPEWPHPFQTPSCGPCSQAPPAAAASARPGSTTVPSRSRRRRLR